MKKGLVLLTVATLIIALHACKKEEPTPAKIYDPTPLTVEVPAFVKTYVGDMPIPADNPMTEEGVALGRILFYEKMLSNDRSMNCATCHKQENAFDDPRPFSQGTNGAFGDRNAMAIINVGWDKIFFWDGRRNTLEGQAHDPVTNPIEMANTWPEVVSRLQNSAKYPDLFFKAFGTTTIDSNLVTKAIAQFERTMVSFNSKFDKYFYQKDSTVFTEQEKRGLTLFSGKAMCNMCHLTNTLFTDRDIRNNGLDVNPVDGGLMKFTGNPSDKGKFKVPTLRNIEVTAPYMHDSRFTTLEQVVEFYSSGVKPNSPNLDEHMPDFGSGLNLNTQEKADLVAFLKTLSDQTFLTDPKFSDPN
ncbi:MAG TPA: cytochrome c peroxidase [Flavipsychrobacter sp.]|nr:cytochrome c peroxidase [Flavipsychrobacter sp.]